MPAAAAVASSFDLAALRAALGDMAVRFDADAVGECDSTNTQLLARAEAGVPSGAVLIADRQNAGRGRRGRTWISEADSSLTFSLLWRFAEGSTAPTALSLVVGLAVVQALDALGAGGTTLKWPNDVLYEQRKLAGILVELQPARLKSAVIGIGLNLRLPAALSADVRAGSAALDEILAPPPRELLLAAILAALATVFDRYAQGGFAALRPAWLARHAHTGKTVRLISDHAAPVDGVCAGVDAEGALLLLRDGEVQRVVAGEISLRPA